MAASKESHNSWHFSVSPLNFLNSSFGNRMLLFEFGMPAFPASALSFSSSISFTFSSIFTLSKLLWASNSSFAYSRFSLSSSNLSWLRNLSSSISAFISICFCLFLGSISKLFFFSPLHQLLFFFFLFRSFP